MNEKKWITEENGIIKVRSCAWSAPGDHPTGCGVICRKMEDSKSRRRSDASSVKDDCAERFCFDGQSSNRYASMKRAKEDRGKVNRERITGRSL